jgi:putative hydrolase of the HAD superfamily
MGEILLPLAGGGSGPAKWPRADEIEAVLLDAGNTLLFLDFEAIASAVRETRFPIEVSELERAEYEARRRADRLYLEGNLIDADMWKHYFTWMLEAAGLPEALLGDVLDRLRTKHRDHNLWRDTRPGIPEALGRIKASGRKLAVISNSDGTAREGLRRAGLLSHLDAVIDSFEVGIEKPDSGIFHLALGEISARPDQALYVGDLESIDVRGARRAGIMAVLVDPYPPPYEVDYAVLRSVTELPAALGIGGSTSF